MSTKAPVSEKKKVKKTEEKKTSEDRKYFGDFADEMSLGDKYQGFYKQLHQLFTSKFEGDEKKFLKHLKKKGDEIELEFEIFDVGRDLEKKEIDEKAYIDDIRGLKCSKCGSTRTGNEERQFRSLDEGSTKRFMCENCFNSKK